MARCSEREVISCPSIMNRALQSLSSNIRARRIAVAGRLTLDCEQVFGMQSQEAKHCHLSGVDARSLEHGLALSKKKCKRNPFFPFFFTCAGAENLPIWTFELLHGTK